MRRYLLPFAILMSFVAMPANAQSPVGIAFVQAPEQSAGTCLADNMDKAFACARQKCSEQDGVVKVRCEGSSREWLRECTIVKAWDNSGKEQELVYSLPAQ